MIEQKLERDRNLGFWSFALTYCQIILAIFQKISCLQMKLESVESR